MIIPRIHHTMVGCSATYSVGMWSLVKEMKAVIVAGCYWLKYGSAKENETSAFETIVFQNDCVVPLKCEVGVAYLDTEMLLVWRFYSSRQRKGGTAI